MKITPSLFLKEDSCVIELLFMQKNPFKLDFFPQTEYSTRHDLVASNEEVFRPNGP